MTDRSPNPRSVLREPAVIDIPPNVEDSGLSGVNDQTVLFITYSRRDSALVREVVHHVRAAGVAVFWDQDTLGGVDYLEAIASRIKQATLVAAILTEHSAQSRWVKKELVFARHSGRQRLPMRIGEPSLPDGLLLELITTQIKDFPGSVDAKTLSDCILHRLESFSTA
ncbi:MAG: toll/interleukin-1 receptor domain-containing protein [Myxococcota bacterium]